MDCIVCSRWLSTDLDHNIGNRLLKMTTATSNVATSRPNISHQFVIQERKPVKQINLGEGIQILPNYSDVYVMTNIAFKKLLQLEGPAVFLPDLNVNFYSVFRYASCFIKSSKQRYLS